MPSLSDELHIMAIVGDLIAIELQCPYAKPGTKIWQYWISLWLVRKTRHTLSVSRVHLFQPPRAHLLSDVKRNVSEQVIKGM